MLNASKQGNVLADSKTTAKQGYKQMTIEQMQERIDTLQGWVDDYLSNNACKPSPIYTSKLCALYDMQDRLRRKLKANR